MDYSFVSSTFVIVVVLPATSFSRTVQPITYSFGTVNDGETESSIQYGTYTASSYDPDYDTPKSLAKHPSRLAHHYYDPPTETSSWPENRTFAPTTPASTTRRSRKKNDHVPRMSSKPATTAATTTPSADSTSTESIMSPVRVRKKGRWLRVRNEIPVNEDSGGETPSPQPSPLIQQNGLKVNRTLQSNSSFSLPANSFRHSLNSSRPMQNRPSSKLEVPKNGTRSTAGVKTNQQKWNHMRSTTTENPTKIRRFKNSSLATAESLAPAHPIQVLHYTTEATTEMEIDFVTQRPMPKSSLNLSGRNFNQQYNQKYKPAGRNVDQLYHQPDHVDHGSNPPSKDKGQLNNPPNRNADQPYNSPHRNVDQNYDQPNKNIDQPSNPAFGNNGYLRKINVTSKTTPVPKYKEAYFRRPPNRPRITETTLISPQTQPFSDTSGKEQANFENPPILTTEQPHNYPQSEPATDLEDEYIEEPGTHHESLTYSDTEKTEKTEEILQDMEYPDEEDDEESEVAEDFQDPVEESPSKILHRPMRYSYSSDQNISESQTHHEPQNEIPQTKKKEGGGEQHKSAHHKSEGDKAEEDYESAVEYDKGKKGHSDKENRKHHQEEEQGKKKKLQEEGGHQESHHVSSKGEKGTLFGESGSHKKGHSTKGKMKSIFNPIFPGCYP